MGIRMPLALVREPLFLLIVSSRDVFPSQFAHAFSFGQIEGDDLVHGIAGFLDVVEQDPRRTLRQLPHILPDGRQPGHTVLSQRNAVKTCDGNILTAHTAP